MSFRRYPPLLLASLALTSPSLAQPSGYVNTLRGSDSHPGYSRGNTFPGVTLPFGFNFWTPVTDGDSERWLYEYGSTTLEGFGLCHQPSPWIADHGALQIMPMVGSLVVGADARKVGFSHGNETARAHYYSVELASGIKVEIAPTDHASAWRFTFPSAAKSYLLFDTIDSVSGSMSVDQAGKSIEGYVDHNGPRLYFFAKVDKAIGSVDDPTDSGVNMAIGFATASSEVVNLTMGTSFISVDQAKANLAQEVGGKSFDQVRDGAQATWDSLLGRVEVEGATTEQLTTFYSSLYRAFMYPNSMWENVDGTARYKSPYSGAVRDGKIYVNNGFWDTFRSAWPLYALLAPSSTGEMLQGFVNAYEDGGWTPRWTGPGYIDIMVGTHPDIVFADAYAKGIEGFDAATAYESMLKNAMVYSGSGAVGRKGNQVSIFKGYIPTDVLPESAAWYLEDVINDFGIARLAEALSDDDNARYFLNRSHNYVNLFSPSVGFFRGKQSNGAWRTPDDQFAPNEWGYEFTEGCPWHYVTAANNDPQGMANLYGGRAGLAAKIDSVFAAPRDYLVGSYGGLIHEMLEAYDTNMGQYAHANEPIHHMLYMYNYAGAPHKTQQRVRDVLDESKGLYGPGYDGGGYLGDEDNGQMSAWFVFSALGFYPSSPGRPEYAIGSPLFKKATLHLENGSDFVVSAPGNTGANRYIQSATLNGAEHTKNFITHEQILAGGTLELVMGASPSSWGTGEADVPSSTTRTARVPVPMVDRALGGTASATLDNADNGEGVAQAFDDDSGTKWLAAAASASISYAFASERSYSVSLYTLTSGNDDPTRDPRAWTLSGSDDGSTWTELDARSDEVFEWRRHTRVFAADNAKPYRQYKLDITQNNGAGLTQLAEIEFLGDAPIEAVSASGAAGCADSEGPEKAIDGSIATKWCSPEPDAALTVDLGTKHAVSQLFLRHAGAGGEDATWNTRAYRIELSLDGTTFAEAVSVTDNAASETQHTLEATEARYVKLTVVTPTQGADVVTRLYELEVYGQSLEEPPPPNTGGMGGAAGSSAAGSAGAASGAGGNLAAGSGGMGGTGSAGKQSASTSGEGCGCKTTNRAARGTPWLLFAAFGWLLAARSRRGNGSAS